MLVGVSGFMCMLCAEKLPQLTRSQEKDALIFRSLPHASGSP